MQASQALGPMSHWLVKTIHHDKTTALPCQIAIGDGWHRAADFGAAQLLEFKC